MNVAAVSHVAAIELCLATDDLALCAHNVRTAAQAGVARVELCADMAHAGLTPRLAAVELARRHWTAPHGVMAMLRPRPGDFGYSATEITTMLRQLPLLAAAGADAVVTGALQRDGDGQWQWAHSAMQELSLCATELGLSFAVHRAIDACADPLVSWQQLLAANASGQLAVARVLSSGCAWHDQQEKHQAAAPVMDGAVDGIERLRQMAASSAIELVVAGKVSATNLAWLAQQLQIVGRNFSFHLYSGVLRDGKVDPQLLAQLFRLVSAPDPLA